MGKFIDIAGQKFSRLTVLHEISKRNKGGNVYWKCMCDCGRITEKDGVSLRRGQSKSCGCLTKELNKKPKPWFEKRFCNQGHDTRIVGRTSSRNCKQCKDDQNKIKNMKPEQIKHRREYEHSTYRYISRRKRLLNIMREENLLRIKKLKELENAR